MNIWKDMNPNRVSSKVFDAVIEIPKGSKLKCELDKETGLLKMDRVLYTSTQYPHNYGFIPLTYCDDNDPLDVFVLCSEAIPSMTIVKCFPIGVVVMTDKDEEDAKIIAIPVGDPQYNGYTDVSELPHHLFDEIRHFLKVYKQLENKKVDVKELGCRTEAVKVIETAIEDYKKEIEKGAI